MPMCAQYKFVHHGCMESDEREANESQLRIYELIGEAIERRSEVVEVVYSSSTPGEAQKRIQKLFGVSEPHISQAVLDMQVCRWTRSERERLDARVDELRRFLAT